jgi:VWFA-related protein
MTPAVRPQRSIAALAALGFLLSGPMLSARPAHAAKSFTESTDVVVVEVPVQVIKDGEPVRGLTAADFELFDGRKKVPLAGFEVLDLDVARTAAAPGALPASARRHFLMLFDLVFSDPYALLRARQAAKDVVGNLHATDLVAVATYSVTNGPQLILGFTPDRAQAVAAIDTLGFPQLVQRAADPLRLVLSQGMGAAMPSTAPTGGAGATADARAERDAMMKESLESITLISSRAEKSVDQVIVRNMTVQFADLARLMGAVDGRKYVVLLSEGFDSSLVTGSGGGEAGVNDLTNSVDAALSLDVPMDSVGGSGSDSTFGDTRTQNFLEKMLTEFRRADCQIQAVDIGGLRALAAEGRLQGNGRESLFTLAKSTGGELYENANDLAGAMKQMLRRTGITYVLSFQPKDLRNDGEFHKLRVELANAPRGARVVHRPGYYAPRPFKEQPPLQRALDTADAVMGQAGGSIGAAVLAAPFGASGGRAYVPVVIEVDGPTLLAGKQDPSVPVEIYVYAVDEQGAVQGFLTQSLALDLAKAEAGLRQSGLKFFGHLSLPQGNYEVRTFVRNGTTGASSLRVSRVTVPGFSAGEAVLLPPLFPEPAGRWVMVRETIPAGAAQPPYPFMHQQKPFIPASRPVLVPGQPAEVILQGYNLGSGELTARAELVGSDGKTVPGGAFKLAGKEGAGGGIMRLSGTFEAPALKAGEYALRVTLTDAAGKAATSTGAFVVR